MFSNNINFWFKSCINITAQPSIVLTAKGTWGPWQQISGRWILNWRHSYFKTIILSGELQRQPKQCEAIKYLTFFPQTDKSGCQRSTTLSNWWNYEADEDSKYNWEATNFRFPGGILDTQKTEFLLNISLRVAVISFNYFWHFVYHTGSLEKSNESPPVKGEKNEDHIKMPEIIKPHDLTNYKPHKGYH